MNRYLVNPQIFWANPQKTWANRHCIRPCQQQSKPWLGYQGNVFLCLFSVPRPFFSFPLKIKSGGSLAILADLSLHCECSCIPSPKLQGFDRTRLILGITVRSKLIASRGCKTCLSPSPYGLKLSRQFVSTEALKFFFNWHLLLRSLFLSNHMPLTPD